MQVNYFGVPSTLAKTDTPPPQAPSCDAPIESPWTWIDSSGQKKTDVELQTILKRHQTWLDTSEKKGAKADLSGTKLKGADLGHKNLSQANLSNSDLSYANLTRTILNQTELRRTNLECARLNETYLQKADLTDADLSRAIISPESRFEEATLAGATLKGAVLRTTSFRDANLSGADLSTADLMGTQLQGADLRNANLKGAHLIDTQLSATHVEGTDFFGAIYEAGSDPNPKSIAYAKHLENMTYQSTPESLARLRASFKEAGFRDQERTMTFVLKSRQAELLWETCDNAKGNCFESLVNSVLFDSTSQYGMNPGRVLLFILSIFGVSTVLYWAIIHRSHNSGLSIVVPFDHNNQPLWLLADLSKDEQEIREGGVVTKKGYRVTPRKLHQLNGLAYWQECICRESALLWVSFVFSLMSTFNIKFRDVDFGRWIKQLTIKEYEIKATGWARTVSGTQALLSVYFIGLLLVTYFGRPFE